MQGRYRWGVANRAERSMPGRGNSLGKGTEVGQVEGLEVG